MAISSGLPPTSRATEARIRLGTSKKVESSFWCGYFFHSMAAWAARIEVRGMGACPARFRYVVSSNSNHSLRQSINAPSWCDARRQSRRARHSLFRSWRGSASISLESAAAALDCWSQLKMPAQFAERRDDDQLAWAAQHCLVFQHPGVRVGDVHGIQTELQRRIDVAAGAVADHPAVRFHNFVLIDERPVGDMVFLRHDLDKFEEPLQTGALHLG